MDQLNCKFEIKQLDEQGRFVGLASTYSLTPDLGGDIVTKGAFTRTLQARGNEVPILYQHNLKEPIGLGRLTDTASGLQIDGQLVLEVSRAKEAYALMKAKVLKGLSIGYDSIKSDVKDGIRYLRELKLYEVSLVTIPMNELATVAAVKSHDALEQPIMKFGELLADARKAWR
jgi:uncharacterized protein